MAGASVLRRALADALMAGRHTASAPDMIGGLIGGGILGGVADEIDDYGSEGGENGVPRGGAFLGGMAAGAMGGAALKSARMLLRAAEAGARSPMRQALRRRLAAQAQDLQDFELQNGGRRPDSAALQRLHRYNREMGDAQSDFAIGRRPRDGADYIEEYYARMPDIFEQRAIQNALMNTRDPVDQLQALVGNAVDVRALPPSVIQNALKLMQGGNEQRVLNYISRTASGS